MITAFKFYATQDGHYVGATDGPDPLGENLVEVPFPPSHCKQVWNGQDWSPYTPPEVQKRLIMEKAMGSLPAVQRAKLASTLAAGQLLMDANDSDGMMALLASTFDGADGAETEFLQYVQGVLTSGK